MSTVQDKKRRVRSVEKVSYSLLKRMPPILAVEVEGWVDGPAWTAPELRPLSSDEPTRGGLLELEFVAAPPSETRHAATQPVRAELYWREDVEAIEGVKIYAANNDKTTLFGGR